MDAEQVSRDLFGRPCRLPLALWILNRDERFFQSEPPRDVGTKTAVRQELSRLAAVGMIMELPIDGKNRVYYEKTRSPLWAIIQAAANVLAESRE